jgi:hypothetical protein
MANSLVLITPALAGRNFLGVSRASPKPPAHMWGAAGVRRTNLWYVINWMLTVRIGPVGILRNFEMSRGKLRDKLL